MHGSLEGRGQILSAAEERSLIARAQAGDQGSKQRLLAKFNRLIRAIVRRHRPSYDGSRWVDYGDFTAAGRVGFLVALGRFNLDSGYRLSTYARHYIANEVRAAAKAWHYAGFAGETRAERRAPTVTRRADSYCEGEVEEEYGQVAVEVTPPTKVADSHDMNRLYSCLGRFWLSPHLGHFEGISRTIDYQAVQTDLRALRQLAKVGRRQHALMLAVKDRTPIEPLFDVEERVYSVPVNTSRTAVPPADAPAPSPQSESKLRQQRLIARLHAVVFAVTKGGPHGPGNHYRHIGTLFRLGRGDDAGHRQAD
jgi:hypothetical protein